MITHSRTLAALVAAVLTLALGPSAARAQKALVYCPTAIDASGCSAVKVALSSAFPGGVDGGFDGADGTVDLKTADLFSYAVVVVPSLAETDSAAPYAVLRDPAVASRLRTALLGRRAFWSGTPDQGLIASTRPQKDALIRSLAAWASTDFGTVNAPGLVVLQDNSDDVTARYSWVQAVTGFRVVADPRIATYGSVRTLNATGATILGGGGTTLAYANMASYGFQTPTGASGVSMDAVGQTGTTVGGQVVLLTQLGANTGGALITTDTDDYPPGTPVIMTGSGFAAGETVTLTLHEDPVVHPDQVFSVTADASGSFTFSGFAPEDHDLDVRFVLTATGTTSGRRAQTTFTDGKPNTVTIGTPSVSPVPAGGTVTFPLTIGFNGTFNASNPTCTANLTATAGASWSAFTTGSTFAFSPAAVTSLGPDVTSNLAINVPAGTPGGLHTFVVTATSGAGCQSGDASSTRSITVTAAVATSIALAAPSPASVSYGSTGPVALTSTLTRTSGGAVVSGAVVTFTVDGTSVGTAITNASGVATLATYNPSALIAGSHTVQSSAAAQTLSGTPYLTSTSGTQTLAVNQAAQAITLVAIGNKIYGDADFAVSASGGGSGNPVTLTAAGSCTITAATVHITGVGSCSITANQAGNTNYLAAAPVSQSFTIGARAITVTADAGTKGYGDVEPAALTYTVTTGSLVTGDAFTGALARTAGEAVGSYPILVGTLAAGANYTLSFVGAAFTITTRAVTITADAKTKGYGDADPALTYQLTAGSLVGTDAFTGTLSRVAGESVGSYTITQGTVTLGANYAVTYASANLSVTARAITITAAPRNKFYGQADPALTYTLTTGTLVGTDAFTGSLARVAGENAGAYAIQQGTVSAGTNYALTYAGADLTIAPKAIAVTANPQTKVYGNADPTLTYQLPSGSLVGSDALTGALTRAAGENVGTYAILQGTLTGGGNYVITYTGADLSITTRAISVTADAQTKVYGDLDPAFTYQVTNGSLVTGDAFTGVPTRDAGNPVGTYAITQGALTAGTNYVLTFISANLTVTARPITVSADAKSKVYGDLDPALTHSVTTGNLVYGDALAGALSRAAGTDVGTYAIQQGTLSASANYTLSYVGANLTITVRSVTATADAKTKTYGDADPLLTVQVTSGSLAYSDAFTGTLSRAVGENVAAYAIGQGSLALNANYALTFVGASLAITTRAVTVTADAKTKVYGDADPALTHSITSGSLAFSDALAGSLSRAAGENVGTYAITQGSLALSANYVLTYVGANLTITPRAITATADGKTKVYGDADPALTHQITSGTLVGADAFTGTLARASGENVGTWAIQQGSVALSTNYTLTFVPNDLTITPRPITVTADARTKIYGNLDPALTAQVTTGNLAYSDVLSGALARAPGEPVGAYAIGQGALTAGTNYTLTYVGALLSITPRPITVQPTAPDLVWTGSPLTPVYSLVLTAGTTLGNGDAISALGTGTFSPTSVTIVGVFPSAVSGLSNANYAITPVAGTVTVLDQTKPVATITELNPVPLGTAPTLKVNVTDVATGNSNIVSWRYSLDGVYAGTIAVSPAAPNVNLTATLSPYTTTDVVQVCAEGTDAGGNTSLVSCGLLAIYDPTAGFVTGGGWIMSPAGAYAADSTLTGKANFGFVSKYLKGANVPTGNTEFQFHAGNLNFKSTSFQWLVISGTHQAQFKGVGTINGTGSYNFLVTAIDGDAFAGTKKPDSFRMKISTAAGDVVYDNQYAAAETSEAATIIGGGSIQIKTR